MPRKVLVTLLVACCAPALGTSAAQAAPSISGPASVAESAGTATYSVSTGGIPDTVTISVAGGGTSPATANEDSRAR